MIDFDDIPMWRNVFDESNLHTDSDIKEVCDSHEDMFYACYNKFNELFLIRYYESLFSNPIKISNWDAYTIFGIKNMTLATRDDFLRIY